MINTVTLIGRLGNDPETRTTPSGSTVAKFSIAVTDKYNGEDHTYWFRCNAWGKLADIINQYCVKGSKVAVSGKLTHRRYEDGHGNKRESVEITVRDIELLTPRQNTGNGYGPPQGGQSQQPRQDYNTTGNDNGFVPDDDGIPF